MNASAVKDARDFAGHTPGPWVWTGDTPAEEDGKSHCPHNSEWCHHGPDLVNAAEQAAWDAWWKENPKGNHTDPTMPPVPTAVIQSYGYDADGIEITAANARLIASAPALAAENAELREALDYFLGHYDTKVAAGNVSALNFSAPAERARALLSRLDGEGGR